jgi:hypothetical protein
MTKTPALVIAATALALTACGDPDDPASGPGGIEVSDPATQSSASSTASPPSSTESSTATTASGGSGDDDDLNEVEVSDQSGDGSSVLVDRVRVEVPGFVVIVVDDGGEVVGSAAVAAGDSSDVSVPTAISDSGEYEAQLYADDGDGEFDPATDQPVPDDDDDDTDDDDDPVGDDIESDEFDYEVG